MGQYNTIENTASYNSVHSYIHITCSFFYYDDDNYYIHRKYVHVLRLFSFYMISVDPETSLFDDGESQYATEIAPIFAMPESA